VSRLAEPHSVQQNETHPTPRQWSHRALQALLHYGGSAPALFLLFRFLPGRQVLEALAKLAAQLWILRPQSRQVFL
jgi:hypothetical protein